MKCILNPEIKSISGKCGGVLYRTYKRPNGKTETRAYLLPRRDNGTYGYERKTKVTEKERLTRSRFYNATSMAAKLTEEQKAAYSQQWMRDKCKFNGKKYNTLRGYIIARLYAENEV